MDKRKELKEAILFLTQKNFANFDKIIKGIIDSRVRGTIRNRLNEGCPCEPYMEVLHKYLRTDKEWDTFNEVIDRETDWNGLSNDLIEYFAGRDDLTEEDYETINTTINKMRKTMVQLNAEWEAETKKEEEGLSEAVEWRNKIRSGEIISESAVDQHAKRELELFIENSPVLQRQFNSIIENLKKKKNPKTASGKVSKTSYDHSKAWKLWMYWVDAGAKQYVKEMGGDVRTMFPVALRTELAKELADHYSEAIDNGEYN